MGVEAAIRAAVESQGVPWQARPRTAGSAALAGALTEVLSGLDIGHKKDFLASLVGECAQESDWFCARAEYGGPNASYAPYYGRGFVQLTFKNNYVRCGEWLRSHGWRGVDIVADPDALTRDLKLCWAVGVWYYISNISEVYWSRHDWDSISGIINAGDPAYRGPSWAARATACNAAYSALGDDWEDDMPSAYEVAKAVWDHGLKMYGKSPQSGKDVPAGVVLGWIDDQFSWTGERVKEVVDEQFSAVNDRLDRLSSRLDAMEAGAMPTSPETASEAPQQTALAESTAGGDGSGAAFYGQWPERATLDEVEGMPGYYKVQKGDTARYIAKLARVSYTDLVRMNPELVQSYGAVHTGQLLRVRET